ncbi:hypothetical protein U8335_13620 [Roseiconus lacunae]|uniref:hypothetical protein n=1 Tax=Roseiconus lacunae TaxID=2605694 RepID=UPI003088E05D|nr:hypothetical protein U8335_13620 [Stieleria sp. HD01]
MIDVHLALPNRVSIGRSFETTADTNEASYDLEVVPAESVKESEGVVIALASTECFSFVRDAQQLKRYRHRDQILYEFEDEIPAEAENMSIGVIKSKASSLFVVANGVGVLPLIQILENERLHISAIAPEIFLVFKYAARCFLELRNSDLVIVKSNCGFDILRLDGGIPAEWYWGGRDIACCLEIIDRVLEALNQPSVFLLNAPALSSGLTERGAVVAGEHEIDLGDALDEECCLIAKGRASPLVDLRNGVLQTRMPFRNILPAARFAAVAFIALQLCGIGACVIKTSQIQSLSAEAQVIHESAFQKTFPEDPLPIGITSRIRSEHRRLIGTRGVGSQQIPVIASALPPAHAFLSGIPDHPQANFKLHRIEIDTEGIRQVSGTADNYVDLEKIANQLRQVGFMVPELSANSVRDGVSLRLEEVRFVPQVEHEK